MLAAMATTPQLEEAVILVAAGTEVGTLGLAIRMVSPLVAG